MASTHKPAGSPTDCTLEKSGLAREIENVPVFDNLSPEHSRWLAEFPEERKNRAVRKVENVDAYMQIPPRVLVF